MRRRPSPYDHPGQILIDVAIGLAIGVPIAIAGWVVTVLLMLAWLPV